MFREGSVTHSDLRAWRRFLNTKGPAEEGAAVNPKGPAEDGAAVRRDVESLVLLRVLAAQAAREGLLETSIARAAERQIARELAINALKAHWRDVSTPTEAELRADYEANRAIHDRPRRWLLRNLLLRAPAGADRAAVRRRAEELRSQAAAGADFGELALKHSESSTRARKGRIGWVTLDRMEPKVAAAVAQLAAGALSEIIETVDGFTILYCVDAKPAETIAFEAVKDQRQSVLAAERIAQRREPLVEQLRAATSLEPSAGSVAGPDAVAFVYRGRNGAARPISLVEYETFLRSRDVDPASELDERQREHWRGELLVELGLEDEARRLGLLDTPEFQERWRWEKLRADAHEALAARARKDPPVTAAEIAAVYEKNRERFVRPELFRLSAVELLVSDDMPRGVVDRARAAAEDLRRGELPWAEAAAAIDPTGARVRVRDLGWTSRKEFFHLGAAAQAAAEGLEVGGTSDLVQEGRRLMILRMDERRPSEPLPLAEVSERIRKQITRRRNEEKQAAIEARILEDQRIVVIADQHPAP